MAQIEVGFIGYDCIDMAIYLARIFSASGKKTAIIDYTKKLNILRTASLPEELEQTAGFYKKILVINGATDHRKDTEEQEVLVHYFGYHLEHPELKKCPNVVFATDMAKYNAQLLQDVELDENAKAYLVVRNYTSFKYREKFLCQTMGRTFEAEKMILLPFDEADYKSGCYLCTDKKHRLTGLSGEMKTALLNLFNGMSGVEYKRKEQAAFIRRA